MANRAARAPQARNWVFTRQLSDTEVAAHNGAEDQFPNWHLDEHVKFLIYQLETAPSTRKLHAQGFITFTCPQRMSRVKAILGNNPHCEIAHDTDASIAYCSKESTRTFGPWRYGVPPPPGQGHRTDLAQIYADIKEGKSTHDMLEADPNVARYEKAIKFMRFDFLEASSDRQQFGIDVYIFWGATGTGKSFTAVNLFGAAQDYFKIDCANADKGKIWFDGYEGQKLLIIDDFDSSLCTIGYMKVLLDKYKLRLPIKGLHTWACYGTVIITSNSQPNTWYTHASQPDLAALERRITEIRHYESDKFCVWQQESFNGAPIGPKHKDIIKVSWETPATEPLAQDIQPAPAAQEPLPTIPIPDEPPSWYDKFDEDDLFTLNTEESLMCDDEVLNTPPEEEGDLTQYP
nr:MAG: replication associated protein [Cressdnaviricota sp.]